MSDNEEQWTPTPEQVARYTPLLVEFPAAVREDFGIVLDVAKARQRLESWRAGQAKRHAQ